MLQGMSAIKDGTLEYFFKFGIKIWLIAGLLFGAFCAIILFLGSTKIPEKEIAALRSEISKVRAIICEGPVSNKKGKKQMNGWLFLSEDALEFYPYKNIIGWENVAILLDDITSVEVKSYWLNINTKSAGTYVFNTMKAKLWKESIVKEL